MLALTIAQFWPKILDIILPLNESRPYHMQIMTEYFGNQERYYVLILLHMYAAFSIGAMVMLATGTMLITFFQHICGMFKVSWYILNTETATKIRIIQYIYYLQLSY